VQPGLGTTFNSSGLQFLFDVIGAGGEIARCAAADDPGSVHGHSEGHW
jgi:hypothetical protein